MAKVGDRYGPYTSVRRLGAGGMAHTFLGCRRGSLGFEQRVCIKVMRDYGRMSAEAQRLFAQEANFAALLRQSNIVAIVDVVADGALILELVDGVDLRGLLRAMPGGQLSWELAVYIALELCKALDYAHNRTLRGKPYGIVHRDLSPSNVLISYAGEVKLTDFGIAKAVDQQSDGVSTIRGKLSYMAPEQATGRAVDGRTDLFALGVILYEVLAGRRPFDGEGEAETLQRIVAGQCPPLSELAPTAPAGVVNIVERLLRVDPAQRFASAAELMEALASFSPPPLSHRRLGTLANQAMPHETLLTDFTVPVAGGEAIAGLGEEHGMRGEQGTMPMAEHRIQASKPQGLKRRQWLLLASLMMVLVVAVLLLAIEVGERSPHARDDASAVTVP